MPKIKNWSKTGESSWRNDKTGFRVKVKEDDVMNGFYDIVGKQKGGRWYQMKGITGGSALANKEGAKDAARNWMKNTPNP